MRQKIKNAIGSAIDSLADISDSTRLADHLYFLSRFYLNTGIDIGDFHSGKCPVTGDTFWRTDTIEIPYATNGGITVSKRALEVLPVEDVAKKVYELGQCIPQRLPLPNMYSVEEITGLIRAGKYAGKDTEWLSLHLPRPKNEKLLRMKMAASEPTAAYIM